MSEKQKTIFIIILNYNAWKDTVECLESLFNVSYDNLEFVVLDNKSPDNSMEYIKDWLKKQNHPFVFYDLSIEGFENLSRKDNAKITLIQTGENKGYGHGNNIGIRYALHNGADYILILNNDTKVSPNFIDPLLNICESDSDVGIAGGKIYFYDKPNVIWFNGGAFHEWTGKVEHFNFNEEDKGQIPSKEITFITGCMWLVPRRVFEKVGFINEEYFMYVEDLEFCYRVRKAGFKLAISPECKIWHKVGAIKDNKKSPFAIYYSTRNKVLFFKEQLSFCKFFVSMIFLMGYSLKYLLSRKQRKLFVYYIKGVKDGLGNKKEKTLT